MSLCANPQESLASSWFTLDKQDAAETSQLQALTTYKVQYNDTVLGEVDAQTYVGGVLLPMLDLSKMLKFKLEVNEPEGTANGRINGHPFAIDLGKRIIVADNVERGFSDEQAQFINGSLYIDTTLLANLLPIAFTIDPYALTVTLHPTSSFGIFAKLDQVDQDEGTPPINREMAEPSPVVPPAPTPPPAKASPLTKAPPQQPETAKAAPTPHPAPAPQAIPAPTTPPPTAKTAPAPLPPSKPIETAKPAAPLQQPAEKPKEEAKAPLPAPVVPQTPVAPVTPPAPAPTPLKPTPSAEPLLQGDDVVEGPVMPAPLAKQEVPAVKVVPPGEPQPAPATPTIVQKESPSGAQENSNTDVIAKDAKEAKAPLGQKGHVFNTALLKDQPLQPVPETKLNDENLLILTPRIRSLSYPEYLEGYRHANGVFLPLGALTKILEFPINTDPAKGVASGWYIREKNTFSLDVHKREAVVKGEKITFPEGMTKTTEFDILIDATLLSRLLPLDINVNYSQLALILTPREQLPLEARLKREKIWKSLKARNPVNTPDYPLSETAYKPYSVPMVDFTISEGYDTRRTDSKTFTNYSLLASAGLGYMDTNLFMAGNTASNTLEVMRLKAGRRDRNGQVFGNTVPVTEFQMGDINSYTIPLVASTSLGRGVAFTNRDLRRGSQFDLTNFVGDAKPDWEVELYQNGALIDFQVVGTNGRYEFINVPVYYGNNEFRLVFYGPQGETYEQVSTRYIGDSMLKPGDVDYVVSLDEKFTSLFNVSDAGSGNEDQRGIRAVTETEFGITDKLTGSVGIAHLPIETGEEDDYVSFGLRSNIRGLFLGTNVAYDTTTSGYAARLTGITRQYGINFRADQRYYSDFLSEESLGYITRPTNTLLSLDPFNDNDTTVASTLPTIFRLQSRSELDANSSFGVGSASITGGFNVLREEYENGATDYTLSQRVSTSLRGLNIGNTLAFHDYEARTTEDDIDGNLSFRGKFWDYLLRVNMQYGLSPEPEMQVINSTLQKNIRPDLRGTLRLRHVLGTQERTELSGILNWDFDGYALSPRMQIDNNGEIFAGLTLTVSMGYEPRNSKLITSRRPLAGAGAISAMAFLDDNLNGIHDENEEALPNVNFVGARKIKGSDQDVAYFGGVGSDLPVIMRIDTGSLEDPLWVAKPEGFSVVPHTGVVSKIDFPVIAASEVDGDAFLNTAEGLIPYPYLTIELVDAKNNVVATTRSEFDGYFYINKIMPGEYQLRVSPKDMEGKDVESDPVALHISAKSDSYAGKSLVVRPKGTPPVEVPTAAYGAATGDTTVIEGGEDIPQKSAEPAPAAPAPAPSPIAAAAMPSPPPPPPAPAEAAAEPKPEPEKAAPAPAAETPPPAPVVPIAEANMKKSTAQKELYVQLGVFKEKANAGKARDKLKGSAVAAALEEKEKEGQPLYVLRAGPFTTEEAAKTVLEALKKQGFKDAFIP